MKRILIGIAATVLASVVGVNATTSPRDGKRLPPAYYEVKSKSRFAYTTKRAWVQKVQRIKSERKAYFESLKARNAAAPAQVPFAYQLTDTLMVPVVAGYFNGEGGAPYPISTLETQLFGANPTGNVADYWREVSYGALEMEGVVMGWSMVAQTDSYYEGISNGLNPLDARTGEFIKELLDIHDATVDFSQFDNDGPDGVPNSGDDDGFVDFLAVVHSQIGGECINANIWSHRWVYSAWNASGGQPYETNDTRIGGGPIRIDDYSIQPAKNCGGQTIEIGVFCHEFGHAFGLPDLYDTNFAPGCGGDPDLCPQGIGFWGIMGAGNWNSPSSPAHPCAWTRKELGWLTPVDVDWQGLPQNIPNINENAVAYRLAFTDDRFRRSTSCTVNGSPALYCGLSSTEGTARGWSDGGGYGSNWTEGVEREFTYNGSGPVSWAYDYKYELETNYDFAYAVLDIEGEETVLQTYTGSGAGSENLDLSTELAGLDPGDKYSLKLLVETDFSFDDADGLSPTTCGALAVDNVAVTGGGESYSTDFSTRNDGWYQDPADNPVTEYWLVENRQKIGFDQDLLAGGLLITHIDEEVMHAPFQENSAGESNNLVRGVVVEEADGQFDLNEPNTNRGESADVFPGSLNKTAFTSATNPSSMDNTGRSTQIAVTSISGSASTMTANLKAGDPPPEADDVAPNSIDNDQVAAVVSVIGDFLRRGASFYLTNPSGGGTAAASTFDASDVVATSLEWVDAKELRGTVNVYEKVAGSWDLVVTNPDGQSVTLDNAVTINYLVATRLISAQVKVVDDGVRHTYELREREDDEEIRLYRSSRPGDGWVMVSGEITPEFSDVYVYLDSDVEPGKTYYYLLESVQDGTARELHRSSVTVPAREMVLDQNYPNPFNPQTTISFYLPERSDVNLAVYDVSGALVRRLASGAFGVGVHAIPWDGTDNAGSAVGSGVYVYRLVAGKRALSRKMILLK